MSKKLTLLAMAVTAVMALAVPALAQAAGWTTEGSPLAGNGTLTLTGHTKFTGAHGGVNCLSKSMWTLEGGTTTGTVDTFETDGAASTACATTGGLKLLGCKVASVNPNGALSPKWVLHWLSTNSETGESKITITTGTIELSMGTSCAVTPITLDPGSVTATIAGTEMNGVTTGSLSGTLTAHLPGFGEEAVSVGSEGVSLIEGSGMFGL